MLKKLAILFLLLSGLSYAQTFAGNAGSDIFIQSPFRECFGTDDGKSTCFTRSAANEVKTNGALDFQLATRTVTALPPATSNQGRVYLVTDGVTSTDCSVGFGTNRLFCASDGNGWVALTGSSGTGIGPLMNGCIPMAAPTGLVCSGLTDNTQVIRTSEQIQGSTMVATLPNGGADFTLGDGSGLNFQTGHSYLFADNGFNGALHYLINGVDTNATILLNPSGGVYHIDNFMNPGGNNGICNLVQKLPNQTTAIVYADVLTTNETCDPFRQGVNLILYLSHQILPYTTNVPWHIGSHMRLYGAVPGEIGTATTGTTLMPSASYVNPYVSTLPSGFTFNLTSSGNCTTPATGAFWVAVSWGSDSTNETQFAQETQLTFNGTTQACLQTVPPVSFPSNVTIYNIYTCNAASCAQGSEAWKKQVPIANSTTLSGLGALASGNAFPPFANTTGAVVTLGNGTPQNGVPEFGARMTNVFVDCNNVAGAIAGFDPQVEENGGFYDDEAKNCPGVASWYWEGYSLGPGAENARFYNLTSDTGNTSNPSIAGVLIDQLSTIRGVDGLTVTGGIPSQSIATNGSITGGLAVLTSASNPFTSSMVGYGVSVTGAGIGGNTFTSTILSFTNSGSVTLSTNANTTVTGTATISVFPTPYGVLFNDIAAGPIGGTTLYNMHLEKVVNGVKTIDSQIELHNITCSPGSVVHCVHFDSSSTPSSAFEIRAGSPDIPIYDEVNSFVSPRGFEGNYTNFGISNTYRDVGPLPTCSSSDLGGGTCTLQPGSVNTAGRMLLTMGGSSSNATITLTLTYGGAQGLGDDNSSCSFTPVSGGTAWLDNTTWRGTASGTGSSIVRLINGGGSGNVFTTGQTVSVEYICRGY